jgi:hypothetical protein
MTILNIITAFVSVVALIVAYWAHRRIYSLEERKFKLDEKKEAERELSKRQANLVASIVEWHNSKAVVVENKGEAVARNVIMLLDDRDVSAFSIMLHGLLPEQPYDLIQGHSVKYPFVLLRGHPTRAKICLKWDDDYSKDRKYEREINFFSE